MHVYEGRGTIKNNYQGAWNSLTAVLPSLVQCIYKILHVNAPLTILLLLCTNLIICYCWSIKEDGM